MLEAALEGRAIREFITTAHCGGGGGGRAVDMAFLDENGERWRVRPEKVDDGGFSREDPPQLPPLRLGFSFPRPQPHIDFLFRSP
jgi:hypothetical protein